jgi:hypothetical protein
MKFNKQMCGAVISVGHDFLENPFSNGSFAHPNRNSSFPVFPNKQSTIHNPILAD